MKIFENKTVIVKELKAVKCDVCQTEYNDYAELQEFKYINFVAGYMSVFGDGINICCDICQKCFYTLLGKYCRIDYEEV